MSSTSRARGVAGALLVPVAAMLLVGCGSIQEAVDSAQGAVDSAQSLLQAPEQIGKACESAVAALAPGQSAASARAGLDAATEQLDAALGGAASLPGIADLRGAFVSAGEALGSGVDSPAGEAARAALEAACATVS